MAKLDSLIAALFSHQAHELFFRTGTGVTIRAGDKQREIMNKPLGFQQIESVLREIMPETQALPPAEGGGVLFHYRSPSGEVQVAVERLQEAVRVMITPAMPAFPVPPPPVPAAPPPPESLNVSAPLELLQFAAKQLASDVHLRCGVPPMLRVGGELVALDTHPPLEARYFEESLFALAPDAAKEGWAKARNASFVLELPGVARARVLLLADHAGPAAVVHLAPLVPPTLEELGLSAVAREVFATRRGFVLVASPAGGGKTTTLAAVAAHLVRTRTAHVVTVEDPIEFVLAPSKGVVTQREVGVHAASTTEALRQAFRLDADVVLVGDLRDIESIAVALKLAEAGKLVLAAVSAASAPQAVASIVERFPQERQPLVRTSLAQCFAGATCQVLVRRSDGARLAAMEVLASTPAVRQAIRDDRLEQLPSLQQAARREGSLLLEDALADVVRRGLVEEEDALALAPQASQFYAALGEKEGAKLAATG